MQTQIYADTIIIIMQIEVSGFRVKWRRACWCPYINFSGTKVCESFNNYYLSAYHPLTHTVRHT